VVLGISPDPVKRQAKFKEKESRILSEIRGKMLGWIGLSG
jgi:peroxiredoxin